MCPNFNRGYLAARRFNRTLDEVDYATRRLPDCLYISKSFDIQIPGSRDFGQPARNIYHVFDDFDLFDVDNAELDWMEEVVNESPGGRVQVKIQVAREAGKVRLIEIQKVTTRQGVPSLESIVTFKRQDAERLIDLLNRLPGIPVENANRVRLSDDMLNEMLSNPRAIESAYEHSSTEIRRLIQDDVTAADIAAIAHRRDIVKRFQQLLQDAAIFDEEATRVGGKEKVWQELFESDPWLLGVGLSEQLLTSWNDKKLEQVVAGGSVARRGKRVDALMQTNGAVRSLVFAEIKHHRTTLLDAVAQKPYRAACWAPAREVAGGVTQIQQTVYSATHDIGEYLNKKNDIGDIIGDGAYLVRPRSYLVVGSMNEICGEDGSVNEDKFRSFELFRRNLHEPVVVTFDELLARAKWIVESATGEVEA